MNIFDACVYLHKVVECDIAEIERLRRLACQLPTADPSKEFTKGSPRPQAKFAAVIDKAVDLEMDLIAAINAKLDYEREVYKLLNTLDPLSALVLRKRYIEGMTVKEIALELDLSERRVHDIKSRAIRKCEESHTVSLPSVI